MAELDTVTGSQFSDAKIKTLFSRLTDGLSRKHVRANQTSYDFTHPRRGMAIVISNENFQLLSRRPYADVDIRDMWKTFRKLHFDVFTFKDLTKCQILCVLKNAAKLTDYHHQSDCFACVIGSHGEEKFPEHSSLQKREHVIYGTDKPVKTNKLTDLFSDSHCSGLRHKPKLFFIQACRNYSSASYESGFDMGTDVTITSCQPPMQPPVFELIEPRGKPKRDKVSCHGLVDVQDAKETPENICEFNEDKRSIDTSFSESMNVIRNKISPVKAEMGQPLPKDNSVSQTLPEENSISQTAHKDKVMSQTVPKDKDLNPTLSKNKEMSQTSTKDKVMSQTVPKDKEIIQIVPKDKDLKPTLSKNKEISQTSTKDQVMSQTVPKDKEISQIVPKDKDLKPTLSKNKGMSQTSTKDKVMSETVPKDKEMSQTVPKDKDLNPTLSQTEHNTNNPTSNNKEVSDVKESSIQQTVDNVEFGSTVTGFRFSKLLKLNTSIDEQLSPVCRPNFMIMYSSPEGMNSMGRPARDVPSERNPVAGGFLLHSLYSVVVHENLFLLQKQPDGLDMLDVFTRVNDFSLKNILSTVEIPVDGNEEIKQKRNVKSPFTLEHRLMNDIIFKCKDEASS